MKSVKVGLTAKVIEECLGSEHSETLRSAAGKLLMEAFWKRLEETPSLKGKGLDLILTVKKNGF